MSVGSLYIPRIGPHISQLQNRQTDPAWKYINLSKIYECGNRETEHYNFVLEITVSFLGIHEWEPGIYIGFSPALHLQCAGNRQYKKIIPNPKISGFRAHPWDTKNTGKGFHS
jgi:hypothetical protein